MANFSTCINPLHQLVAAGVIIRVNIKCACWTAITAFDGWMVEQEVMTRQLLPESNIDKWCNKSHLRLALQGYSKEHFQGCRIPCTMAACLAGRSGTWVAGFLLSAFSSYALILAACYKHFRVKVCADSSILLCCSYINNFLMYPQKIECPYKDG